MLIDYSRRGQVVQKFVMAATLLLVASVAGSGCSPSTPTTSVGGTAAPTTSGPTYSPERLALLQKMRDLAPAVERCILDEGYQGHIDYNGDDLAPDYQFAYKVPPEADPDAHPAEFETWAARQLEVERRCRDTTGYSDVYTAFVTSGWVTAPGERQRLWETFDSCVRAAGMPAPSKTATERELLRGLSEANLNSMFSCMHQTPGLWPSETNRATEAERIVVYTGAKR